jgi:hypothetical protein
VAPCDTAAFGHARSVADADAQSIREQCHKLTEQLRDARGTDGFAVLTRRAMDLGNVPVHPVLLAEISQLTCPERFAEQYLPSRRLNSPGERMTDLMPQTGRSALELNAVDGVASGMRYKSDGRGSGFMVMSGDNLALAFPDGRRPGGGYGAWPQLAGWFEQRVAQVLEQLEAVVGHGQAAPAAGGLVENGPDQAQAASFAGEPAGDLSAAAVSPKVRSMRSECRMRWWCSAGNRR